MMLLKQMKYFITIAECGSFTEAAIQCYISQSAISLFVILHTTCKKNIHINSVFALALLLYCIVLYIDAFVFLMNYNILFIISWFYFLCNILSQDFLF